MSKRVVVTGAGVRGSVPTLVQNPDFGKNIKISIGVRTIEHSTLAELQDKYCLFLLDHKVRKNCSEHASGIYNASGNPLIDLFVITVGPLSESSMISPNLFRKPVNHSHVGVVYGDVSIELYGLYSTFVRDALDRYRAIAVKQSSEVGGITFNQVEWFLLSYREFPETESPRLTPQLIDCSSRKMRQNITNNYCLRIQGGEKFDFFLRPFHSNLQSSVCIRHNTTSKEFGQ